MFWVVTILLLAFCLLWLILYPLFGAPVPWRVGEAETPLRMLRGEKERLLRMLKDLEFERESGVLGENEYRELRRDYLEQAVLLQRRIDALEPEASASAEEESIAESSIPGASIKKGGGGGDARN